MTITAIVARVLDALPAGSKAFLIRYTAATVSLAVLDVIALGLLAIVLPGMISGEPTHIPLIGEIDGMNAYLAVITVIAATIVLKSALTVLVVRIGTSRFAAHEVAVGDRLLAAYMSTPWADRVRMNGADIVRSVDQGVNATVYGVLIPASSLISEIVSSAAVIVVLLIAQPATAITTIIYLGLIAVLLSQVISKRSVRYGRINREYSFRAARLITEAVATLKEITLRGATSGIEDAVHENRTVASRSRASVSFLSIVPRFVLESALIIGFLLVGAVGWLTGGMSGAIGAIALFAVAGFRIVPSLTRFQAILNQMHSNAPFAELVVDEIHKSETRALEHPTADTDTLPERAERSVSFDDVTFTYLPGLAPALRGVTLEIPAGAHVALVGASGAGKSTAVDLLLGLLRPTEGEISIGGLPLDTVLNAWRASIGYVPQEVALFDATIAQNVALSWSDNGIDSERVRRALEKAQLLSFVDAREAGIEDKIGERGMSLSGGQRQRLGIARALYNDPSVLVMDEATSALDTSTEAAITTAIREIGRDVTVVTVAHRLATIRDADIVFFFKGGRLEAHGTFDEVVGAVPDFAVQAALAGLSAKDEGEG
ncbi:ABC-type multidrug transport system fused ATPase/permease subunit [Agromyces cerinus]|uniref:ABC transporter ATP-binding protein n=1 Tax=Agromyces cerinus TaxID=33878 RepID=UPI00195C6407|nr:ABC transporter ATP-binding protein [Agromyces cerinus]MBM7830037.1 ABC-type multidrug transport system fused ATPase/permease subunit [Agromyces cerinus]